MDKKPTTFCLFNTDFLEIPYDAYLSWCEDNDETPYAEGSNEFIEWACQEAQFSFECDLDNLKYSKATKDNLPFYIDGSMGLWNGNKEGHYTHIYYGLSNAIDAVIYGCRCDDWECELDIKAGEIYISGHHHDGTNSFTIHLLSKRGLDKIQRDINNGKIDNYDYEPQRYCFKKIKEKDIWG